MSLKNEIYKNPKEKTFNFSLIFLIFVITITIGLYWYNYYLSWINNSLNKEITLKQQALTEKQQQQVLKVYNLYTLNKQTINKLDKYSQIKNFINHLDYITNKYSLIFKGFSYDSWELMTTAYTVSDNKTIDYQKTVKFLREYKRDKNALFTIKPIKWVNTFDNKQKFKITFKIK